jgi:hypothetical protein
MHFSRTTSRLQPLPTDNPRHASRDLVRLPFSAPMEVCVSSISEQCFRYNWKILSGVKIRCHFERDCLVLNEILLARKLDRFFVQQLCVAVSPLDPCQFCRC